MLDVRFSTASWCHWPFWKGRFLPATGNHVSCGSVLIRERVQVLTTEDTENTETVVWNSVLSVFSVVGACHPLPSMDAPGGEIGARTVRDGAGLAEAIGKGERGLPARRGRHPAGHTRRRSVAGRSSMCARMHPAGCRVLRAGSPRSPSLRASVGALLSRLAFVLQSAGQALSLDTEVVPRALPARGGGSRMAGHIQPTMPEGTITCPKCGHTFEMSDAHCDGTGHLPSGKVSLVAGLGVVKRNAGTSAPQFRQRRRVISYA